VKQLIVVSFEVLCHDLSGGTKEKHGEFQTEQLVSGRGVLSGSGNRWQELGLGHNPEVGSPHLILL
jgi:hypothetical protein